MIPGPKFRKPVAFENIILIRAYWRTYINYYTFVRPNVFRAICGEEEKEGIILFERKLLVVGTGKLKYRNLSTTNLSDPKNSSGLGVQI